MIYDSNKVSIIGCGKVGMSAAYSMLHHGTANEIILFGRDKSHIIGEELDLEHAISFLPSATIKASDNYADIENSDVVVITAGAAQKPGETRLDLTKKNLSIIESIIPNVVKYAPNSIILIVSNPVDILTYRAYQIAGWPKGRIFGSGTTLDTARFRFHLSEFLKVSPRSIHAYILGEHGDSSFPVVSSASVGGQQITTLDSFSEEKALKAFEKARQAAYSIIASKGSTFYGIGAVISHIVGKILRDARSVLPVSIPLHQYYGNSGMAVSVPCVVGRNGVEKVLEAKLDWHEKQMLEKSVENLKSYL